MTVVAAGAALSLTATAQAVTCPTVGEELPAGLYVASTTGDLWRVTPLEGKGVAEARFIGEMRDDKTGFFPTDIAFNDDGSLYGVDGFDLFCIDPYDGTSVAIGGSQFDPPWQTALAGKTFSLGQLYGAGEDQLLHIQIGSGKGTPSPSEYGPLSCGTETGDLVFDPDTDTLWGTVECIGGGLPDRSHLVKVDSATGAILANLGPITDRTGQTRYGVFGLAMGPDGSLYAGAGRKLMRIDPASGKSLADYTVVSVSPTKQFDRIDGMASRVCESEAVPKPVRRTAGQWRQECRDGLDPEMAQSVGAVVAWVTDGAVTDVCDALHHVQPKTNAIGEKVENPYADRLEVLAQSGRRGSRTELVAAKAAGGNGGGRDGMDTLCALGLRELTAAHLNVASGRANAACWHCEEGMMGRYLDELTDMLHVALADGDTQTCNLVKREAHHITSDTCENPQGGGNGNQKAAAPTTHPIFQAPILQAP